MKRMLLLLLAGLLLTLSPSPAEEDTPVANFNDHDTMPLPDVLHIYQKMSRLELVIDSRVKVINVPIKVGPGPALITKREALRLVERKLIEQAGVVITRLDDKRASVTYNDALTIAD